MMNHMQGGPPSQHNITANLSNHGIPRRDYHGYVPSPQSPMHSQSYMNYHAPYYQHPPHNLYQQPRWHLQQYPPPQFMPAQMQLPQYPPRSPMMNTPHRPAPIPHLTAQATQSPRSIPQYMHYQAPSVPPTPTPATASIADIVPDADTRPQVQRDVASTPLFEPSKHVPSREYRGPLPWYFPPGEGKSAFPTSSTPRRRRRRARRGANVAAAYPENRSIEQSAQAAQSPQWSQDQLVGRAKSLQEVHRQMGTPPPSAEGPPSESSTIAARSEPETPATSHAPSEVEFQGTSTHAPLVQAVVELPKSDSAQHHHRRDTKSAIAVPHLPTLPRAKAPSPPLTANQKSTLQAEDKPPQADDLSLPGDGGEKADVAQIEIAAQTPPKSAPAPAAKSWADLVRRNTKINGPAGLVDGEIFTNRFQLPESASLADALKQYSVQSDANLPLLEPRGLVNTGNMCYMNSILQVLVFCVPFYRFLDQVRQRTVHSLKSDTPLVDAMIMFMREFRVIASAESSDGLRKMLKQEQLEVYGEPVTPEYVYDVIRKLPRFAGMRRGHQQDAEEFLGFLLEGLHDECAHVMQGQPDEQPCANDTTTASAVMSPTSTDGWLEVGPKQRAAVTRTAGQHETPSPITKIFGGHLRSELRVPSLQPSVTLEPFKPLQLDIGAQDVNNIVDALKGLTRTESLTGDFGGRGNTAKKQVFIGELPPVLILHLKRFQYDNNLTGTQKIWKKVGYPLELEIPKDVFQPSERKGLAVKGGLPKYRLIGVVYHHGKSAAGGHYTVDVLRQDSREWVRMDDTVIRRVRPEDVAEGGAEEDPQILAKALEQHKAGQEQQKQRNIYQGLDEAEKEPEEEKPWSEVNGHVNTYSKKWSGVTAAVTTNGNSTPNGTTGKATPTARKENVRDNKVAYILLYERMRP